MSRVDNQKFDSRNEIGLCGVFCKGCPAYLIRCYGCRSNEHGPIQKRTSKWKCRKRVCVLAKNLHHCGECTEFSCKLRHPLEKSYIEKYGIDLGDNCIQITKMGHTEWIEAQTLKYTCKKCQQFFSPYDIHCKSCNN